MATFTTSEVPPLQITTALTTNSPKKGDNGQIITLRRDDPLVQQYWPRPPSGQLGALPNIRGEDRALLEQEVLATLTAAERGSNSLPTLPTKKQSTALDKAIAAITPVGNLSFVACLAPAAWRGESTLNPTTWRLWNYNNYLLLASALCNLRAEPLGWVLPAAFSFTSTSILTALRHGARSNKKERAAPVESDDDRKRNKNIIRGSMAGMGIFVISRLAAMFADPSLAETLNGISYSVAGGVSLYATVPTLRDQFAAPLKTFALSQLQSKFQCWRTLFPWVAGGAGSVVNLLQTSNLISWTGLGNLTIFGVCVSTAIGATVQFVRTYPDANPLKVLWRALLLRGRKE